MKIYYLNYFHSMVVFAFYLSWLKNNNFTFSHKQYIIQIAEKM